MKTQSTPNKTTGGSLDVREAQTPQLTDKELKTDNRSDKSDKEAKPRS